MPPTETRSTINGVSLLTRAGKSKSRYSESERLRILGATKADLNATIRLFCPDRPLYAATRRDSDDPRAWTTPRGRLMDSEVLRHLTGNLTPDIKPRWIAPHAWEATWWIGIDVDFRGDREDFQRRCQMVIQALAQLGVPKKAILTSLTPSGGRHYRFFTTRKIRVTDIPQVLALVGLHEMSGQIELFPKLNKGMRLPFGYIPGREHDPRRWLRFIRAYRRGKFPRVNWIDCLNQASKYAQDTLESETDDRPANAVNTITPPCEVQRRRITRVNTLGIPKRLQTTPIQGSRGRDRYRELLSRPITDTTEATELWNLGICETGTRVEATKRLAWHLLFAKRLPIQEAANGLVKWVYETGRETSTDVRNDQLRGTRKVEEQTRELVRWMADHHTPTHMARNDLSHFSQDELNAIHENLGEETDDETLVSAALSFLRFAKLRGAPQADGWLVQIAVNGVMRKWPGCGGMKYKPIVEVLTRCGLITVTREKRQSSNGTGRPRTYLIRIQPDLRTGAALSHEDAIQRVRQLACTDRNAGMKAPSSECDLNTYRRSNPPPSSEKLRKNQEVAEQAQTSIRNGQVTPNSNPTEARVNQTNFRHAETARLQRLNGRETTAAPTRPLNPPRSTVSVQPTSVPMDQMVDSDHFFVPRPGLLLRPRRFRQPHKSGLETSSGQDGPESRLLDRSLVSTATTFPSPQRRRFHEFRNRSS